MLLATPLALLLTGLMSWISVKGDSLQISAIVTLLGVPLPMGLDVGASSAPGAPLATTCATKVLPCGVGWHA